VCVCVCVWVRAHVYRQREENRKEEWNQHYTIFLVMIFTTLLPVYTTVKCTVMSS